LCKAHGISSELRDSVPFFFSSLGSNFSANKALLIVPCSFISAQTFHVSITPNTIPNNMKSRDTYPQFHPPSGLYASTLPPRCKSYIRTTSIISIMEIIVNSSSCILNTFVDYISHQRGSGLPDHGAAWTLGLESLASLAGNMKSTYKFPLPNGFPPKPSASPAHAPVCHRGACWVG
jgi:hypothetical protein